MEEGRNILRLTTGKLIPRDMSESLGKLPPQALDLEVTVLGAVMLEKGSISAIPYLKPEHFYDDRHAIIFAAIQDLHQAGAHPDFRLVSQHLRTLGKLDTVGGGYYVAELTAKVQGADNIDHHSRVIVELAMKRQLIMTATLVQRQAYEDTTDVFELLQKAQGELKFLEERETASSGPERIKALWDRYRITSKPERPETLIKLGDADVCTVGNISLLVGKKKSRKSLLVTHLLHIFLQSRLNLADDLVVFDTEQEEYDVWQTMERLYRMTNQWIPIFCLRGLAPKERREFIEQTITHWHKPLKIGVIDGIRDCMSNINDPDETTDVMSWLMGINYRTKIHLMNVLHLNKTDNNARGHIGSELLNKAEVTIEVEYNEQSTFSQVKCESSRRKPFEPFCFTHSETGLPEIVGVPIGDNTVAQDEQVRLLQQVFEDQALSHPELKEQIKTYFGIGDTKAKQMIVKFVSRGWILKSGKDRSPNTKYKLLASPGTKPVVQPPPQTRMDYSDIPVEKPDDLPF